MRRILLRENSFCAEDDGEISALRILKIAAKSVQSHDKIGVKFYAKRSDAKSGNFTLKNPYGKISPPKARSKPTKKEVKDQKAAAANPHDEIPPANFFRVKSLWIWGGI